MINSREPLLKSDINLEQSSHADLCIRLLLSFVAGGIIGLERSRHFKEAGVRTHMMVCVTTSLLMIISKYGFADLNWGQGMEFFGTRGADAARIASQAVSGIGFLCAGVIFKVGSSIRGLTTAAGIWLTAGIGMGIGAGMYVVSGFTILLVLLLQYALIRLPVNADIYESNRLQFTVRSGQHFDQALNEQLAKWRAHVMESRIARNADGTVEYELVTRRHKEITYAELKEFIDGREDVITVSSSTLYTH